MTWIERGWWNSHPQASVPAARSRINPPSAPLRGGADLARPARRGGRFERHGPELVLVVPVSAAEALNGALITVPVPGSDVRLRIPPGTTTGHRFQVARQNAPAPDGFGDLTVVVEVG